jgi:hypothetical protein
MYKHWILLLLTAAMIVASRPAHAKNYEVGSCISSLTKFSTIQAAVSTVPAGSTILVCPGVYPEQVTISQPLTLRGQSINNADRPVISVPINPDGSPNLKVDVTSDVYPYSFAAQVLVQNVNPIGNVTILNVTVDGAGGNIGCSGITFLVGIFYASGTSGSVEGVTARNQQNGGCGGGIWIENGTGPNQSIEVANSSVHDFGSWGITAAAVQNPSLLAAKIEGNFVTGNSSINTDIIAAGISGSITDNFITGGSIGIQDADFYPQTPGITISGNSVADIQSGDAIGIWIRDGTTASSNKISNVSTAFALGDGFNAIPGSTLSANTTKNTALAVEYNCVQNATLKSNTFNDSLVAYDHVPTGFVTGGVNPTYNIDTIQTGSCP